MKTLIDIFLMEILMVSAGFGQTEVNLAINGIDIYDIR